MSLVDKRTGLLSQTEHFSANTKKSFLVHPRDRYSQSSEHAKHVLLHQTTKIDKGVLVLKTEW